MRNTLLAIVVAVLPPSVGVAAQSSSQKPDKWVTPVRPLPVKRTGSANSCLAYGSGFVKLEGTETCVKIGGAISIEAGSSSGWR